MKKVIVAVALVLFRGSVGLRKLRASQYDVRFSISIVKLKSKAKCDITFRRLFELGFCFLEKFLAHVNSTF